MPSSARALPPASDWLKSLPNGVFVDSDLKGICEGPLEEIALAILESEVAVEAARFAIRDADEVVSVAAAPSTKIDWLKQVAVAISVKPFEERVFGYLERKFDALMMENRNATGPAFVFNDINFAARFLARQRVDFDPELRSFRCYQEKKGVWEVVPLPLVEKLLLEFTVPHMRTDPAVFSPRPSFYSRILRHCRTLGVQTKRTDVPPLLAVRNGTLHLERDEMRPHSPANKLTNHIPLDYHPGAPPPNPAGFLQYLHSIMDREDVDLLQFWCGAVLLGRNPFHNILVVSGRGGAGKSTFFNLVEQVVGADNIATLATAGLDGRFELSEFLGKTLLLAKDVSADFLSNKAAYLLKSLSGDSGLKAQVKRVQRRVTLGGPFNIAIACNSNLRIALHGDGDAWERRLLVVNVAKKPVAGAKRPKERPDFARRLMAQEGNAIFAWMLRGAKKVRDAEKSGTRFKLSEHQVARVQAMLRRSDPLLSFVRTAVRCSPGKWVSTADLCEEYLGHCAAMGGVKLSPRQFEHRVGELMLQHHQSTKGTFPSKATRSGFQKGYRDVVLVQPATVPGTGDHASTVPPPAG